MTGNRLLALVATLFVFSPATSLASTFGPAQPAALTVTVTSTQSLTVPSWANHVDAWLVGGGGGGGGGFSATASRNGGNGGGAGGADFFSNLVVTPGGTLVVTIGAGGTGGAGSVNSTNGTNGIAGGNTFLSGNALPYLSNLYLTLGGGCGAGNTSSGLLAGCSPTGGQGGGANGYRASGISGQGGSAMGTNINCLDGSVLNSTSAGAGGCSGFGVGGQQPTVGANGTPGTGYGAGGSGGAGGVGSTAYSGGSGAPGFAIITFRP